MCENINELNNNYIKFEEDFCKIFNGYVCLWKGNVIGNKSTQIFEIGNPIETNISCKLLIGDESLEKDGGLDCLEKIESEFKNIKIGKYSKIVYSFGKLYCS
jgi:hypothetical protein